MMESKKILSLALVYRRYFSAVTLIIIMKKRNACLQNDSKAGMTL